jgi:hypothetical protein
VTFFCCLLAGHTRTIYPKRININLESYTFPLRYFDKSVKYFSIFPINLAQLDLFLIVKRSHFVHMYIDLSFYLSIREETHGLHLTEIRYRKRLLLLLSPELLLFLVDLHELSSVLRVQST